MGQKIEIRSRAVLGDVALFDSDRSITGQDGTSYQSSEAASADDFPGRLAAELFAHDDAVDHVFVASNQVSVRRDGGWDDARVSAAAEIIREFFVFYDEEAEPAQASSASSSSGE